MPVCDLHGSHAETVVGQNRPCPARARMCSLEESARNFFHTKNEPNCPRSDHQNAVRETAIQLKGVCG